jgi:hypothetical protein
MKPTDVIDVLLDLRETPRDVCWCSRGWATPWGEGRLELALTARRAAEQGTPHTDVCLKTQRLMAAALEVV